MPTSPQQNQAPANKSNIIIDLTLDDEDDDERNPKTTQRQATIYRGPQKSSHPPLTAPTPHSELLSKLSSLPLTWLRGTHPFSSSHATTTATATHLQAPPPPPPPPPPPAWDTDIRRTLPITAAAVAVTPLRTSKQNTKTKKTPQKEEQEDYEEVIKVMREVRDIMVETRDGMLKTRVVMAKGLGGYEEEEEEEEAEESAAEEEGGGGGG